jgi:spore coat protein U-like protein
VKISKMLAAALLLASTAVFAAPPPTTAKINVSAKVVGNCTITATDMDFKTYDPLFANATTAATATSTIAVRCTAKTTGVTVGLDRGSNADTTTNARRLADGAGNFLTYVINDEAGSEWTTVSATAGSVSYGPFASVNTPFPHTANGVLAGGQDAPVGTYSDIVTATVLF